MIDRFDGTDEAHPSRLPAIQAIRRISDMAPELAPAGHGVGRGSSKRRPARKHTRTAKGHDHGANEPDRGPEHEARILAHQARVQAELARLEEADGA